MHRALTLLRPENDIKVVSGDKHTCVVDLSHKQVFDILLSNEDDRNSIEFVKELKALQCNVDTQYALTAHISASGGPIASLVHTPSLE